MTPLIVIIVVVALVGLLALVVVRRRGSHDGVDSFRRQIDALSAEARRPVIDQVQHAAERDPDDDDDADGERGT